MNRFQLEHLIKASAAITEESDIVVIGSQSILGQFPSAPENLLISIEADLYPLNEPEKSDLIDATIGEASPFHHRFGYYAHGVSPETAILPSGWKSRLIIISDNSLDVRGHCLEVNDLAISKYIPGREKDLKFTRELAKSKLTSKETLLSRLEKTELEDKIKEIVRKRIEFDFR